MESYKGILKDQLDALYLIEAARKDMIPVVHERFSRMQCQQYIKSGNVFIWNETRCRIRRWTDGRKWSASRVKGVFLSYKEMKRSKRECFAVEEEADGLTKRAFSCCVDGERYHVVCYCGGRCETALPRPSEDVRFRGLCVQMMKQASKQASKQVSK